MSVTLIIFALNEIESLSVLSKRINQQKKYLKEIIYIDGGSLDGSINKAKKNKWDVIVQTKRNPGVLNAFKMGIERAQGTHIIFFSPDNNCIPEKISVIKNKIDKGYDFVKASRYLKNAKSYDDTLVTSFGNWMFTLMVKIFYGSKCTDVLGIYYGIKKSLFKELKIDLNNPALNTEIVIKINAHNIKAIDIPADEPSRIGGVTKRSIIYNGLHELLTIFKFLFIKIK